MTVLLFLVQAVQGPAQLAERFAGMTAVSGYEQAMVDSLVALVPGATRDRAGSAVVKLGTGAPRRLIVCPVDESGYIVGNVRDDRYLTLRRIGLPPASPLFDQWVMGRRVTVWTRGGAVPGVAAVPSTHLARGRGVSDAAVTADDLVIEVGAASSADLTALKIDLLNPVTLAQAPHRYGKNLLAAPEVGRRVACAALTSALLKAPRPHGSVVAVFAVESHLNHRGLLTAQSVNGPFDQTVLLQYPIPDAALANGFGRVQRWNLPLRFDGSPVETVNLADADSLAGRIGQWIGGAP